MAKRVSSKKVKSSAPRRPRAPDKEATRSTASGPPDEPAAPSEPRSVALVLGSGGARGLMHVGVIQTLQARGYSIRAIAGSSMGALVGGIHATGKLDVFADWVSELNPLDVFRLVDFSWGSGGLIRGERVIGVLREMIGDHDIESLPLRFTAVAADLDTGREVWLDRGPMFDAIRASIAIPGILHPHVVNGRTLVDGGVVDPLPIGPTMSVSVDLVLVSDVNGNRDETFDLGRYDTEGTSDSYDSSVYRSRLDQFLGGIRQAWASEPQAAEISAFEVALRSMDAIQSSLARYKLAAHVPDIVVRLPRSACTFLDFHRASELIAAGRDLTERALDGVASSTVD